MNHEAVFRTAPATQGLLNTLGLYIFESLRQKTQILFEKSKFNSENSTGSLLSSVAINVNLPEFLLKATFTILVQWTLIH